MHFLDDSLLPENQRKLVIQVAPYGPQWAASDSDDIAVTMDQQVQKAVDCWNAGATVLHVHVREDDGKGSKRLSKFNEMLARLREAVPQMILQVGGSISFAPEDDGQAAKWMTDDTRHMLAELDPRPDQVTVAINTQQMNVMELMTEADVAGTSLANPTLQAAYRDMIVPSNPSWHVEHIRRLVAKGIQPHFMIGNMTGLESLLRLVRRGAYSGPLVLNYVAIGGGSAGLHPADMLEFARRTPDGAVLTLETLNRHIYPMNAMAIAMGMHVRVGIEDTLFGPRGERMSSVAQIEMMVRLACELGREVATGAEAHSIYGIGESWAGTDEALARLGLPPNRVPGQRGVPMRAMA
ncbi:transposase [Variovorax sp. WS11]|uniref:3-keto-5-aminohexanoate cleavage protein n=1 Tax=Variovorax sp. WS11 TaxID=1105204 RepID=UPI000D0D00A1|nr:3-keto-5-aminohexanoate cleavage protein [Variovorax sp. WS11]NDZ13241.1 3-keto-5-aminohexanoate cleavage protein [Variovorax sp. WS11]PSL79041.1 transposase [Variovorax sp. WS11]